MTRLIRANPLWATATALALALILSVFFLWLRSRDIQTTDDAFAIADFAVVSTEVPGRVARIESAENESVVRGQILLRLDDTAYSLHAAAARAALLKAEAARDGLKGQIAAAEAGVREAEAQIAQAGAEAHQAASDRRRTDMLAKNHYASAQRQELALTNSLGSKASYDAARARRDRAANSLEALRHGADEAGAAVDLAKAELAIAMKNLDETVIRAPFDGIVSNRRVEPGSWISPGMAALSVVPLKSLYVEANFKETQLARMEPGQPATISFDAHPDVSIPGTVETLSPASGALFSLLPPENASGNYTKVVQRFPVRIRLLGIPASLDGRILAGMSASVAVDTSSKTR